MCAEFIYSLTALAAVVFAPMVSVYVAIAANSCIRRTCQYVKHGLTARETAQKPIHKKQDMAKGLDQSADLIVSQPQKVLKTAIKKGAPPPPGRLLRLVETSW